jgi:hypothetical protein
MTRTKRLLLLLGCVLLALGIAFAVGPAPSDPLYIRTNNGWKGVYAHADEYAEYSLNGAEVKLQDPYHILLKQQLGMMVTFADKRQFAGGSDLLSAHSEWELNSWRQRAARAESSIRNDLGAREDLRVTEIRLYNAQGAQLKVYLIALASKEGVFVLAVSPADSGVDSMVREIADSFRLIHRPLDQDEVKRLSAAAAGK